MSAAALDGLVDALRAAFERGAGGGAITTLLEGYGREHGDWRAFALFAEDQYTRNLVARDERFELLVLCWGAGQESPIHNHEGQDCWMAVLDGSVEEVQYPRPEDVVPGPLAPTDAKTFERGEVAFIRDEIGLHLVRPADAGTSAVSLHLYAAPYDVCNVYCPDTGRVTRKPLVNHSVRGRLLAST